MNTSKLIRQEVDLDALAFSVARNHCGAREPIENVLAAEGMTVEAFARVLEDKMFQSAVKKYTKELTENGVSFQLKARIQAEELLKRQYILIHDPETPPAVAVKAIENTIRWAGLEPKGTQQQQNTPGTGFQIVFNLHGADNSPKIEKIIDSAAIEAA
jgi:hypothetical protein